MARIVATFVFLILGCSSPVDVPSPRLHLSTLSGNALDAVPTVDRWYLDGFPLDSLEALWLVRGDVSSVSEGKIRAGDVPQTLQEGRVPMASWLSGRDEPGDVVLAATVPLQARQRYSLIGVGYGLIATVEVADEDRPLLSRWGGFAPNPGDEVPYCLGAMPFWLDDGSGRGKPGSSAFPDGVLDGLTDGGVGSGHCVRVVVPDTARQFFVPPPRAGDLDLDPAPLPLGRTKETSKEPENPAVCADLGPETIETQTGCLVSDGPALHVHLAPGTYHLQLVPQGSDARTIVLLSIDGDERRTFGPLLPESEYSIGITRLSDQGAEPLEESIRLVTGAAAPRFVLTEVLADPLGAEPQAEWVELLNVGSATGSLEGLFLWDEAGGSSLPAQLVKPGQYAVIVREDFVLGPDIVPSADSIPVLVASLGDNGLRNGGEIVQLRDSSERILSTIPSGKTGEGISFARVLPWLPDSPESFAIHGTPGNSPGGPNHFSEE